MSLHRYTNTDGDRKTVVAIGWDRPLQGFFMTIIEVAPEPITDTGDEAEDNETFLFNNLEQQIPHPKGINGYLAELEHRGIDLPQQMVNEVLVDGMHNVGNKCVDHSIENSHYVRKQLF